MTRTIFKTLSLTILACGMVVSASAPTNAASCKVQVTLGIITPTMPGAIVNVSSKKGCKINGLHLPNSEGCIASCNKGPHGYTWLNPECSTVKAPTLVTCPSS